MTWLLFGAACVFGLVMCLGGRADAAAKKRVLRKLDSCHERLEPRLRAHQKSRRQQWWRSQSCQPGKAGAGDAARQGWTIPKDDDVIGDHDFEDSDDHSGSGSDGHDGHRGDTGGGGGGGKDDGNDNGGGDVSHEDGGSGQPGGETSEHSDVGSETGTSGNDSGTPDTDSHSDGASGGSGGGTSGSGKRGGSKS